MRCFLKRFSSWSYYLPLVFLSFLLLTILNTTNVSAFSYTTSDISSSVSFNNTCYVLTDSNNNFFTSSEISDILSATFLYIRFSYSTDTSRPAIIRFTSTGSKTCIPNTNITGFRTSVSNSFDFSFTHSLNHLLSFSLQPLWSGDLLSSLFITVSDQPFTSGPTGSLSITANGTYNVSSYAEAVVDVPPVPGDYHNDLLDIKRSIYVGSATLLVIYFFYCIYRMIIKGVKK